MVRTRPFSRIRKRTFVVTGLILLSLILVTGILVLYSTTQLGPEDLIRFQVSEGLSRSSVLGSGVSLSHTESANMIKDASFEPLVFRKALTVYSGDETTLTVSSEEASSGLFGDGFFDDAAARVMTQTSSGLALKKSARVEQYGINRVGIFQAVKLPGDMPRNLAVQAFVRKDDMSMAVGEKGLIIRNVTGQMPAIAESGLTANLTGICATSDGYLACSDQGDLIFSADGEKWAAWPVYNQIPLHGIAASEKALYVAVGDSGTILTGQLGQGNLIKAATSEDLRDIVYGSSTFVAVGRNGTILTSQTGLIWHSVDLKETVNWQAADYRDGRFTIAGDHGAVAISDDGINFRLLKAEQTQDYIDIVMLSKQQMIVLNSEGGFAVSNNSGGSWLQSGIETGMRSRIIALAGKDKILSADASGNLGLAQLVAEIQLDSLLKEGQYQAGDLIFLEKTATEIPEAYLAASSSDPTFQDPWDFFGDGSTQRIIDDAAPGGGEASMMLAAAAGTQNKSAPAIISQIINPALLANDKHNEVYRIELWMKQSNVSDRSAQVWLTGPFKSVGTTFTNVGATWKKYSFTFVMPSFSSSLTSKELRLNIAAASGTLWIDRVSFTRGTDSSDLMSNTFQSEIQTIKPQIIRLDFLSIGGQSVRQESWANSLGNENPYLSASGWASQYGNSLHAGLKLVLTCDADPWLIIDSYTSESELLNLIEYLAGPISEPYGKLRLEQGAIMPWAEQFNRIMIEIADTGNVYQSDQQKADYVNLMIQTISSSPYYRQIKGQLIFIDGMTYSAGVVLSTADYHASDLEGTALSDHNQAVQDAFLKYYDQIPRNPEKPAQTWLELMRSARLKSSGTNMPDLADLAEILLGDLGKQSNLSNLSLPARDSQDWQETLPAAATIVSACAKGVPLDILDTNQLVKAFGYKSSGQIAITLTSQSAKPVNCQFSTDLPLSGALLYKYDSKGKLISQQTLKRSDNLITVLPGGVVLLIKDLN